MKVLKIDTERLRGALSYGKSKEVAEVLDLHPGSISRKIKEGIFSLRELNLIAEHLGRDTIEFLYEEEVGENTENQHENLYPDRHRRTA